MLNAYVYGPKTIEAMLGREKVKNEDPGKGGRESSLSEKEAWEKRVKAKQAVFIEWHSGSWFLNLGCLMAMI